MVGLTFAIEQLQFIAARDVLLGHDLDQLDHLLLEVVARPVQQIEQGIDGVEVGAQPGVEMTQVRAVDPGP